MNRISNGHRLIFIVDDDKDNLKILKLALENEGYKTESASNGKEAIDKLSHLTPDLVLLDVNMPGLGGIETLGFLRLRKDYIAVIFVSGNTGTQAVVTGLDAGADDYIRKPFQIPEMLARVRAKIRIKDLQDDLREANRKLKELVEIDDLTGLFNMRSLYQKLDFEILRAKRTAKLVTVVMMDLDHFKSVNDSHDHLFGSYVLTEVGKILKENVRNIDFAARYGGDEFLMVLTEASKEGSQTFCERIRTKIEATLFQSGSDSMRVTSSIGFSMFDPTHPVDSRALVRAADRALYEAKDQGRNRVCFVDSKTVSVSEVAGVDPLLMRRK
jgi:two-component system cell cycle response regulator